MVVSPITARITLVNGLQVKLAPEVDMVEVSNVGVNAETEVGSCDSKNMSVERLLFVVRITKGNKIAEKK